MDNALYDDIMAEIGKIIENETLVIVEGINDLRALHDLGITNVVEIKQPLYSLVESIQAGEVVLLVDLDREGKKLYSRLKDWLVGRGVKINDKLREMLFRTPVRQIEGLNTYLEKWKYRKG